MSTMKFTSRSRVRRRLDSFEYGLDGAHDESVTDYNYAAECYNFDFTSGALKPGYGISSSQVLPETGERAWTYRYRDGASYSEQILFMYRGVLYLNEENPRWLYPYVLENPIAVNYRLNSEDVLIICSSNLHMLVWNGTTLREVYYTPHITSMALHFERLFATVSTDPTRVYFSKDLDPTNWSEELDAGGFIELLDERGALNKVISYLNYLYIFREHGISRVTAYGDQSEFSVQNLFVTSGKIFPNTISLCGGFIIFFASDGLYAFDGSTCTRILEKVAVRINGTDSAVSTYSCGKYYLACEMDFGGEEASGVNNALLVYDVNDGKYSISRGVCITFLEAMTIDGVDLVAAADNAKLGIIDKSGARFGIPLKKHWRMPLGDVGCADKTKLLYDIYIQTDGDISLTALTESARKTVSVKGSNAPRRVRFNLRGSLIGLEIDAVTADCRISRPTMMMSLY